MVGCVCSFIGGADLAATNPEAFVAGMIIWMTSVTSFYCAHTLRKIIIADDSGLK
jgi:hypothetical protein